jgi:hypothetical protein
MIPKRGPQAGIRKWVYREGFPKAVPQGVSSSVSRKEGPKERSPKGDHPRRVP